MSREPSQYRNARRRLCKLMAGLGATAIGFGVLHGLYADLNAAGVYWFNLDKERNLPTWFNGVLFMLLGVAAWAAYYWERRRGAERALFRFPLLWLGLAGLGLLMSLDEITILHENLYWREIRQFSIRFGPRWQYLTQWQLLFAPLILLAFGYLALFLAQRLRLSRSAGRWAICGLACWLAALLPEAIRPGLKLWGSRWYTAWVVLEEELEMFGAILLLGAVGLYALALALDLSPQRLQRLRRAGGGFLTRPAALAATGVAAALGLIAAVAYTVAGQLAERQAPVPALVRRAAPAQARGPLVRPRPPATPTPAGSPRGGAPEPIPKRIWFDDLGASLPAALTGSGFDPVVLLAGLELGAPARTAPPELAADREPRIVFLALSDGRGPAHVTLGSGSGILAALRDAGSRQRPGAKYVWCRIELVAQATKLAAIFLDRPLWVEPGLQGLALSGGAELALLPDELLARGLVEPSGAVRWDDLAAEVKARSGIELGSGPFGAGPAAHRFTTQSYFVDLRSWAGLALYRGHPREPGLSREQLLEAARLGGRYLVGAVGPDGRMAYTYRADRDAVGSGYNILRHAGTAYALLELYQITREPELLAAAERALGYLKRQIQPLTLGDRQVACVVEDGSVKLGGNALAVIAFAAHAQVSGSQAYHDTIRQLVEWIVAQQQQDGRFAGHKQAYPSGRDRGFVSSYYPGEALLALLRADAIQPQPRWVDAAERGARWLIEVRDGRLSDEQLSHDHWLMIALNELYRLRPRELFLSHALRLARLIVASQLRQTREPDWTGGFYTPPRTTPTAIRCEGLAAAYQLARDFQRPEQLESILQALRLGNRFQLQAQILPPSAMLLPDPQQALGGFRASLTSYEVRIDYVQHSLSSLLALHRIQ